MTSDEHEGPPVLSAEGLKVARGKRVLIRSIDLRVERGEVCDQRDGANLLVAGSAIFGTQSPAAAFREISAAAGAR